MVVGSYTSVKHIIYTGICEQVNFTRSDHVRTRNASRRVLRCLNLPQKFPDRTANIVAYNLTWPALSLSQSSVVNRS